jgi:hypothetical protein
MPHKQQSDDASTHSADPEQLLNAGSKQASGAPALPDAPEVPALPELADEPPLPALPPAAPPAPPLPLLPPPPAVPSELELPPQATHTAVAAKPIIQARMLPSVAHQNVKATSAATFSDRTA